MQREGPTSEGIRASGVPLLDDWLGGIRENGSYLLTGGPGSGKSTIALHFADAGLRRGESVAMLAYAHADDVLAHARHVGVNLDEPLRDGRLLLLRYRADFVHRATQAVSPEQVVVDLARMLGPHDPSRIIIDTVSPFVSGPPPVGAAANALSDMLGHLGGCALLTFPEDMSAGYDRSLEPLVQRASAVIQLVRDEGDIKRAELLNLRYPSRASAAVRFVIRPGGILAEHAVRSDRLSLRVP